MVDKSSWSDGYYEIDLKREAPATVVSGTLTHRRKAEEQAARLAENDQDRQAMMTYHHRAIRAGKTHGRR